MGQPIRFVAWSRDGTQIGSIQVAQDKARSAIAFRRPTKALEDAVAGKMKFIGNPMKISGFPDPSTRAPARRCRRRAACSPIRARS